MSSFLKNLIIICYEGRVTVHVRKTMQERTLLNIAILTGLQTCGILCHTQSVGHLVLKFLRGVLNPDQKSVICHLSSYFICIGNPIYYRIFMSTYLIFFILHQYYILPYCSVIIYISQQGGLYCMGSRTLLQTGFPWHFYSLTLSLTHVSLLKS